MIFLDLLFIGEAGATEIGKPYIQYYIPVLYVHAVSLICNLVLYRVVYLPYSTLHYCTVYCIIHIL